jgi:succinate dehydrogenase/fumarate reductase cytochrome b subunit
MDLFIKGFWYILNSEGFGQTCALILIVSIIALLILIIIILLERWMRNND